MKLCASVPGQESLQLNRLGLATVLAEEEILITPLLVAGDDPLVVCKDACFSKLVHTLEGFWRRVVVE